MALSKKRQVFVEEYLRCWNQTEAARRAGYKNPHVMGCRLMKVKSVADTIAARIEEKAMSADEVLLRLAEQARGDISEFMTITGAIDWDAVGKKGYLVKSILHRKGQNSKIELYDSQSALALLGKHHRLFVESHVIKGEVEHTFPQFDDALERAYGDDGD